MAIRREVARGVERRLGRFGSVQRASVACLVWVLDCLHSRAFLSHLVKPVFAYGEQIGINDLQEVAGALLLGQGEQALSEGRAEFEDVVTSPVIHGFGP